MGWPFTPPASLIMSMYVWKPAAAGLKLTARVPDTSSRSDTLMGVPVAFPDAAVVFDDDGFVVDFEEDPHALVTRTAAHATVAPTIFRWFFNPRTSVRWPDGA